MMLLAYDFPCSRIYAGCEAALDAWVRFSICVFARGLVGVRGVLAFVWRWDETASSFFNKPLGFSWRLLFLPDSCAGPSFLLHFASLIFSSRAASISSRKI